jgi:hypothetical protein
LVLKAEELGSFNFGIDVEHERIKEKEEDLDGSGDLDRVFFVSILRF